MQVGRRFLKRSKIKNRPSLRSSSHDPKCRQECRFFDLLDPPIYFADEYWYTSTGLIWSAWTILKIRIKLHIYDAFCEIACEKLRINNLKRNCWVILFEARLFSSESPLIEHWLGERSDRIHNRLSQLPYEGWVLAQCYQLEHGKGIGILMTRLELHQVQVLLANGIKTVWIWIPNFQAVPCTRNHRHVGDLSPDTYSSWSWWECIEPEAKWCITIITRKYLFGPHTGTLQHVQYLEKAETVNIASKECVCS